MSTNPVTPEPVRHVDYPHTPGTLYDCPACEAACFCIDGFQCVHCALQAERTCPACDGPLVHLAGDEYWCPAEQAWVTRYGGDAR
jgi:hypothetical protein